jgi:hypothetical protein
MLGLPLQARKKTKKRNKKSLIIKFFGYVIIYIYPYDAKFALIEKKNRVLLNPWIGIGRTRE